MKGDRLTGEAGDIAVLPGRKATGKHGEEEAVPAEADRDEVYADSVR